MGATTIPMTSKRRSRRSPEAASRRYRSRTIARERLVAIVEIKKRGGSDEEALHRLRTVKREVTSAISKSHGVRVADLVLVPPGSIPITTSGKVRRSACVERYRQDEFIRLDATA